MEIFKNFAVGLSVLTMAILFIGISVFIWPFILIAGGLALLLIKFIFYISLIIFFIITIGYIVRKGIRKD